MKSVPHVYTQNEQLQLGRMRRVQLLHAFASQSSSSMKSSTALFTCDL
jgi:hypothetical protein